MHSSSTSRRVSVLFRALAAVFCLFAGSVRAQAPIASPGDSVKGPAFVLVTGEAIDVARLAQLAEGASGDFPLLLRSPSTLTSRLHPASGWAIAPITPQFLLVTNSALPFSQNYGSLWAGRGTSTRTTFGARLENSRVRVILAPEVVTEGNREWLLRRAPFSAPAVPPELAGGGFVFPFYVSTFPLDQPMRFGDKNMTRLDPGESSLLVSFGKLEAGLSTEHEWWGPGIRNAIVLSNNAPGFAHATIRTARPLRTRFGNLDARWLIGGLTESRYFDTVSTNNVRSLASIAATLQTEWDPNLSVGFARSVYATADGWGSIPFRWLDIFANTHRPSASPGSTAAPVAGGKDQIFSLFVRWVFPADGVEIYGEWARTELPHGLREMLVAPNHTQGYTLGFQWAHPVSAGAKIRVQSEVTQLEQSATFRNGPQGSWYTSRTVPQGYTNRGRILGASIGPGASSQWAAIDYIRHGWRAGVFAGRIRWNEDVHSTARFPIYVGYCNHDVSLYPGARAAASGRFGMVTLDYSLQNRLNAFFQNDGGCPNIGTRLDIRNNTLSLTFSPFRGR